jgi:tRNA dimethylallyltransferase
MNKLLVICGPTATGKTDLAIKLAKKFSGEIVSADSRQVYKGMDVITGKDIPRKSELRIMNSRLSGIHDAVIAQNSQTASGQELRIDNDKFSVGYRLKEDIPIWLVDIVEPDYTFNVGEYKKLADKVIDNIRSRNLLPIIVGGTGLYIKALTVVLDFLIIPPNKVLRKELSQLGKGELGERLRDIDSHRWERMNESDRLNPRRLIRAIEISQALMNKNISADIYRNRSKDNILMIGLGIPTKQKLYELIDTRVEERLKGGVLAEVEYFFNKHYDLTLPALSATGFKPLLQYIERTVSLDHALRGWKFIEHGYARRQLTWFRRDKRIHWFDVTLENYRGEIEDTVRKWYTEN